MQEQHPFPAPQRGVVRSSNALAVGAFGRRLPLVLVALLVVAGLAACGGGGKKQTTTTTQTVTAPAIHFHYPSKWSLVPKSGWAKLGVTKAASAVLERTGKTGVIVVLRGGPSKVATKAGATAEANKLNSKLKAQFSDYKLIKAQTLKLPHANKALLFTYVRTKQGVLHTITIIPAGKISYVVESASPPNSKTIGKEIGSILRSARLGS